MSKVKILSKILSSKIAAGEIIDRPASIVKELIENSIDAECTRVKIEVSNGGKSLIRVIDNGEGMHKIDALLSIRRHSTSKIEKVEDLFKIKTFGFRGEAIPSIASVSEINMITKTVDADIGTQIDLKGGEIRLVSDMGASSGTVVSVKNLFYNLFVRKKFLKTAKEETLYITNVVTGMALARPDIHFRLVNNNKLIKNWRSTENCMNRIVDVFGEKLRGNLFPFGVNDKKFIIRGWIADPMLDRSTGKDVYIFVNGRWIKDRIIKNALLSGYLGRLIKGRYPIAVIFINLPYDQVDINVHPSKEEVRFVNKRGLSKKLKMVVREILGVLKKGRQIELSEKDTIFIIEDEICVVSEDSDKLKNVSSTSKAMKNSRLATDVIFKKFLTSDEFNFRNKLSIKKVKTISKKNFDNQMVFWENKFFLDLIVIGQYKNTYILCEFENDLIVIDQHAAHERIIFDKLKQQIDIGKPILQELLLPEIIEVNLDESEILEKLIPILNNCGVKIEFFGIRTYRVKSVPMFIINIEVKILILQLVSKVIKYGIDDISVDYVINEFLSIMACHGSIRANQHLKYEQIKMILSGLDVSENSSSCPHGRPIWIRLKLSEFEKRFKRII